MILRINAHLNNGEIKVIDINTEKEKLTTSEKYEIIDEVLNKGNEYIGNDDLSLVIKADKIIYCDIEEIDVI